MSSIFGLADSDRIAMEETARANPHAPDTPQLSAFEGLGEASKGLLRPSAGAGRAVMVLASPLASGLDWAANLNPARENRTAWRDSYFSLVDDIGGRATDYWTADPEAMGGAAKAVSVLSQVVGSVPQMVATPGVFLAGAGVDPATELTRQGVDAPTALTVGGVNLASNAIGMRLPAAFGTTMAQKVATGAGANLALGAATDVASAGALSAGGYEQQAAGYDPADPYARGLDLLMGAAFGAKAGFEAAPALPARDAQQDAVLTARNNEHMRVKTLPGVPSKPAAQTAHANALTTAIDQVLAGDPIDVARMVDVAQFTPRAAEADPMGGYTPEYRRALESGGVATAKNPQSSAYGADQFTRGTWLDTVRKARPAWAEGLDEASLLALRADPVRSGEMAAALDRENAAALRAAGQPVDRHTMYAAHHFGAGKAVAFARAADSTQMSDILTPAQMKANKYLAGKTKAQAIAGWDARAAKAGVEFAPAAAVPAREVFQDPEMQALAQHAAIVAKYDISADAARALEPVIVRDTVTGFFDGRAGTVKSDVMVRAVDHVSRTGEAGHYVSADIVNLGGLNEAMGNRAEAANEHYRAMAGILEKELRTADGIDIVPMRTGGDEFGAVVLNADTATVDAAIARAMDRVRDYAEKNGLADIPHPKRSGEKGVGLHIGRTDIRAGDSPREIFDRADDGIDYSKRKQADVTRIETATAGAAAPARQAGGAAGGAEPAARGARARDAGAGGGGEEVAGKPAQRGPLDDIARQAQETPDAEVSPGLDADGEPIRQTIAEALQSIEIERQQAVRDAEGFAAAVSCFLRRGAA